MNIPTRERGFCTDRFCSIDPGTAIAIGSAVSGIAGALGGGSSGGTRKLRKARSALRNYTNQGINQLQPYAEAGLNAFNQYQDQIGQQTPMYGDFQGGSAVPQYSSTTTQPNYLNTTAPPEYQGTGVNPAFNQRDRFQFNMQEDPGYQFTRDQALQATTRQQNAGGNQFSGNILTALQDRAGGLAAQYSDQQRRNALNESRENYGRGVTEYGLDTARNQDIYGRGVTDYGIQAGRERDIYGRGVQDFNILADLENQKYQRGVTDYGLGLQGNQAQYARDLGEYGLGVSRNQDIYGRDQNQLNRLGGLSDRGYGAAGNIANLYSGLGTNLANVWTGGAAGDAQRNQFAMGSINNAAQGYLQNTLLNDYIKSQQPASNLNLNALGGQSPLYGPLTING